MIRLLAIDIDGTLLDSKGRVPQDNIRALARAGEAGVEIAPPTGRRDEVARDLLARVPHCRDGAAVTFDRPGAQVVFEAIDWEHPRHRRFFAANREYLGESNPLENCLTEDPVQLMFSGGCADMRAVFDELQEPARAGFCSVTLTEYLHRDFSLVDILRAGISKGSALRDWAERRGVAAGEVMAIGDNHNDVEMLQFAGTAVVMGNACAELKARGWAETACNDDCGFAQAVEA